MAEHLPNKKLHIDWVILFSKLAAIIKSAQSTVSMDTPATSDDDSSKIADFIVDNSTITPDGKVSQDNFAGRYPKKNSQPA